MCRGRATTPRATASGGEGEVVEPQGQPVRDHHTGWRVVTHEKASRSDLRPSWLLRASPALLPLPRALLR